MRRSLFTAVAVAPLVLFYGASAVAQTTISGSQTTPVATATANNGQPSDVSITGSVSVSSATTPAVLLNSSNNLTSSGSISISNVDSSTTVQILGGNTGSFVNSGSVTNSESYVAAVNSTNGIADGAFAQGSGRYGVRVTGTSPFIGDSNGTFTNAVGGSITVQGNSSFGVSVEAPLQGDLLNQGTISATGNNTVGLSDTGGGTGKILITGSISATGLGAAAVQIGGNPGAAAANPNASNAVNQGGNLTGSLSIYSAIESTGYRTIVRSTDPATNALLQPDQLQQAGSAVSIQSNIGGGVFIGQAPAGTVSTDTTTDADHDGIVDSLETAGSVTTYGSAPAMVIGAAGRDVHLGEFGAGTSYNLYGLIIEGAVTGNGLFNGNAGNALQIGVPDPTGVATVHIDGGVSVTPTAVVTAQGYEAGATAIHFESGTTASTLSQAGTVSALATSAQASNTTAILIDPGATVTTLNNAGAITSTLTGDLGSAYAVVDKSGTLSTINNSSTITASIVPASVGDTTVGHTVALDLSANTHGVTLTQIANPNSTTTTPLTSSITGDILFGSGTNEVDLNSGTITGAMSFGAGQGTISVASGASYAGALTATPATTMILNVNGTLEDDSATSIKAGSLAVGPTGLLLVTADPAHGASTNITVSGAATIAAGGQLGLHLLSLPVGPETFTAIQTTDPSKLSVSPTNTSLAGVTPYLFVTSFQTNQAAGTVDISLQRRTAAEAGLNRAQSQAFDAVYNDLPNDAGIERAFLAQTTQAGLSTSLNQMMPDYAGGVFRALSWAAEAQGVATGDPPLGEEQAGPTRAWTQEIVLHETKKADEAAGYNILGFGFIAGLESVSPKGDALGVKFGFTTAEVKDSSLPSDNLEGVSELNTGVYWRGAFGGLRADAQLGAGFVWINNRREFLYSDTSGVVHDVAIGNWDGYTLSGRVGLHYTAQLGAFFIEPRVHADYFRAQEASYAETGSDQAYNLKVSSRSGDLISVTGSVVAGATFGEGFRWRPQIEVGYRSVLSGTAGDTTAVFEGGSPFTMAAESIRSNALIGRIGLRIYSDYLDLLLDAGAQYNKQYTDFDVRLTARTLF